MNSNSVGSPFVCRSRPRAGGGKAEELVNHDVKEGAAKRRSDEMIQLESFKKMFEREQRSAGTNSKLKGRRNTADEEDIGWMRSHYEWKRNVGRKQEERCMMGVDRRSTLH